MSKDRKAARFTRRAWVAGAGGALALGSAEDRAGAAELRVGKGIYESIGVQPLINARGTVTIVGGSQTLPEVKAAMDEASRHFVQIDELMEAAGRRIAELTGAESAIVTTGAAGALQVATCACVAGADPDKMELLSLRAPGAGLKYDVIIPQSSRNAYDHSIRAVGANILEPATAEELNVALGPNTALVMLFTAARDYNEGPLSVQNVVAAAHKHGVPVIVDAAAENPTKPNAHLSRGADLVVYSGGKTMRGPQCAGLLLGRRDLVQAAWVNSAPHHTVCRALKVGKEEIVGMLAAVETWFRTDHTAKEKLWTERLEVIANRLRSIPGVNIEIRPPRGLDNRAPHLGITWDPSQIDLTEDELEQMLWDGKPRIAIGGKGSFLPFPPNESHAAGLSASMLMPGEEQIVADRLYGVFSATPKAGHRPKPAEPALNLTGLWDVHLEFVSGRANHLLSLQQSGNDVVGAHQGQAAIRDVKGAIDGKNVLLRSSYTTHGARLNYTFNGEVNGDTFSGSVLLGEYGNARFTAQRHQSDFPRGGKPTVG